jgi:hypothetical protein
MNSSYEILQQVLVLLAGTTPVAVVFGVIAKSWVEKRIEHSIAHEYARKLASYEAAIVQQQEIRQRAALMADILSSWLKTGTDRDELNKLSFEAFLWLPQEIAADLSNMLAHKPGAPSVRDLIIKTRQHLLGSQDSLTSPEVIVFPETAGYRSVRPISSSNSGPRGTNR